MESSALAISEFVTRLIIPIGVVAAVLGLLVTVQGLRNLWNSERRESAGAGSEPVVSWRDGSSLLERVAASLCGTLAVVLVLLIGVNMGWTGVSLNRWTATLLGMIALLTAPALLWRTRYRKVGEGIGTVAIAGIAVLTGFSIGFVFVPLVGLMIWLCVRQLWRSKPALKSDPTSG
jgi:hypothetical protein